MVTGASRQSPRKVLVTGARTGIGLGIALAYLRQGNQVVLTSRAIEVEQIEKSKEEIVRYVSAGQAILIQKDVTQYEESRALVKEALEALGGSLDVLVNNAGGTDAFGVQFEDITPQQWQNDFALNLDSVFWITQAALPHLKKSRGNIVNISSVGGMRPANVFLPYCVTKAGLDQLTRCIALEYSQHSVRCNSINPGAVETPIFLHSGMDKKQSDDFLGAAQNGNPLKRAGQPHDVASLTMFLADDEQSGWITGQNIVLDGGATLAQ